MRSRVQISHPAPRAPDFIRKSGAFILFRTIYRFTTFSAVAPFLCNWPCWIWLYSLLMNGCVLCTDFLRRRSRRRSAGRGYGNRDRAPTEFRRRPVCLRLACLPGARQRKVTILVRVQGGGETAVSARECTARRGDKSGYFSLFPVGRCYRCTPRNFSQKDRKKLAFSSFGMMTDCFAA
jgi:hypothetical protein